MDAAIARGSNGASSPFFPNDQEVKEERFLEGGSRFFHQLVLLHANIATGYEIGEDYSIQPIQPKALRDVSVGSGRAGACSW